MNTDTVITLADQLTNGDRWLLYQSCVERIYDANCALRRRGLAAELVFETQPFDVDRELPPSFNYAVALRADPGAELAFLTDYLPLTALEPIVNVLNDFVYAAIPYTR